VPQLENVNRSEVNGGKSAVEVSVMAPRESNSTSSRGRIGPLSMQVLIPTKSVPPPPPKTVLPVELLERIVEYMPVQTQLRFARTSRPMRDMVYDDARWVAKLQAMGVWDEDDARRAAEEEMALRREALQRAGQEAVLGRTVTSTSATTTIFDVNIETKKLGLFPTTPVKVTGDLLDLQLDSPEAFGEFQSVAVGPEDNTADSASPLDIFSTVVSRRGLARSEFGRIYAILAPLYIDLTNANSMDDAKTFRHRQQPEERAKLLKVLELFGRANAVDNWTRCQRRMNLIIETFERQMITEFEE
jgi:recyclin-1